MLVDSYDLVAELAKSFGIWYSLVPRLCLRTHCSRGSDLLRSANETGMPVESMEQSQQGNVLATNDTTLSRNALACGLHGQKTFGNPALMLAH